MVTKIDRAYSTWLNDQPGDDDAARPDKLARALDALYATGPGPLATTRAQARLRGALRAAAAGHAYYDVAARTPIGPVFVAVGERGVLAVRFGVDERSFVDAVQRETGSAPVRSRARVAAAVHQVRDYLAGRRQRFDLPVDLGAISDFQRRVLLAACQIPRGQVRTYADVARQLGRPRAARAVGQALRRNPVPIVVPCHRVLGTDGTLRGYAGPSGIAIKERLLRLEGAL